MNTLESMKERFDLLPEDFKQAIRSFDYDKKLQAVSVKFKLHIDQLVALEKAMSDIVFGDLRARNLAGTLATTLRIKEITAIEIASDLNQAILMPLKDHIKDVQNENYELAHPKPAEPEDNLREVL